MKYELNCGTKTHTELSTKAKAFCMVPILSGIPLIRHVCPICLGHPGVLPKLNKKVLEYAILAGLATNCEVENIGFATTRKELNKYKIFSSDSQDLSYNSKSYWFSV